MHMLPKERPTGVPPGTRQGAGEIKRCQTGGLCQTGRYQTVNSEAIAGLRCLIPGFDGADVRETVAVLSASAGRCIRMA
jgi:hypothetical protein